VVRPVASSEAAEPNPVRASPARVVSPVGVVSLAAGATVWVTALGALAVHRHQQFLSHRFDLGNMVQAVWSTAHGSPLEMTDGASGDQIVRLGAHVDPILVLFAPLWWINPKPETLIVAYIATLGSAVFPIARLALKHTRSHAAVCLLATWYLILPWTIWIGLNEVNPVGLALPLLLWAIWYLDEDRLGPFAVFATFAVLTGELVGLTVAALGVWYALRPQRRLHGSAIAVAGSAWTAVCIAVIIPVFNDGEPSRYYAHFERVGSSPIGLVETMLADPAAVIGQVTTWDDARYLLLLALPTALLFLGQPLLMLVLAPQLGVNLLSSWPATTNARYHYAAPVIAVLVATTVMAIGRLPSRVRVFGALAPLWVAVVLLGAYPPVPGTDRYLAPRAASPARIAAMRQALDIVPASAAVSVTNRLGAHLSARRIVHLYPAQGGAEWTVLDLRDPSNTKAKWIGPTPFKQLLARLDSDPRWHLIFERQSVRVYRREVLLLPPSGR
jgi:uncharacterized membrane protein